MTRCAQRRGQENGGPDIIRCAKAVRKEKQVHLVEHDHQVLRRELAQHQALCRLRLDACALHPPEAMRPPCFMIVMMSVLARNTTEQFPSVCTSSNWNEHTSSAMLWAFASATVQRTFGHVHHQ